MDVLTKRENYDAEATTDMVLVFIMVALIKQLNVPDDGVV